MCMYIYIYIYTYRTSGTHTWEQKAGPWAGGRGVRRCLVVVRIRIRNW